MRNGGKPVKGKLKKTAICITAAVLFSVSAFSVHADQMTPEERLEINRAMDVASNNIPNWPTGPVVGAESALLMEAGTGTILYSKNIHTKQYPASTTKILTTLIAAEKCGIDEVVSFSHDAVFDTPRDSNHIAMDVGQELTMEQCLNAILIRSSNEVSFAVAEHITGTSDWSVFADLMNERAKELGCLNSHFVNPNGLPDEDHYTTAYDLAMIGRAFFDNEMLCRMSLTKRLEIPASDTIKEAKIENNMMQIIPGGKYAYEYLVGCKTGYTDSARSSLVSCAEKNGMKLICVVMRDEAPYQYEDTISLFEYGFSNFEKVNVSQADSRYKIDDSGMFIGGVDIFGSSKPILSLNREDYIILPRTISLEETDSSVSYETDNHQLAAIISYSYQGVDIGNVRVEFTNQTGNSSFLFDTPVEAAEAEEVTEPPVIFIDIFRILIGLGVLGGVLIVLLLIRILLRYYHFSFTDRRKRRRRNGTRNKRRHF